MKRGDGLARRTPLAGGKPLQTQKPMARGKGIERVAAQPCTGEPKPAKAKRKTARDTGPSKKTRDALAVRSGGVCELCGRARAVDPHHRHGRLMGGTRRPWINRLSNLLHLCRVDHDMVTDTRGRRLEFEAKGWLLREGQMPLEVPVLLAVGLVVLDDVGGMMPSLPLPGVP